MNDEPVKLLTTKSDADRAKELLANLEQALKKVCLEMDAATDAGFVGIFQLGQDFRKKYIIATLKMTKEFL